jgi:hypothetical protein
MNNNTAQHHDHTACPAIHWYSSATDTGFLRSDLAANFNRVKTDRTYAAKKSVKCTSWRLRYTIGGQTLSVLSGLMYGPARGGASRAATR